MTTINTARRAFLRGSAVAFRHHVPWAVAAFEDVCRRCNDCIAACEEAILRIGDGGYPTVDFSRGMCTFCGACVSTCRYGALDRRVVPVWRIKARVGRDCLSARGVACRSCGDACEPRSIGFRLMTRGRALPQLDPSACNGCGACVAVCPTKTIHVEETA